MCLTEHILQKEEHGLRGAPPGGDCSSLKQTMRDTHRAFQFVTSKNIHTKVIDVVAKENNCKVCYQHLNTLVFRGAYIDMSLTGVSGTPYFVQNINENSGQGAGGRGETSKVRNTTSSILHPTLVCGVRVPQLCAPLSKDASSQETAELRFCQHPL